MSSRELGKIYSIFFFTSPFSYLILGGVYEKTLLVMSHNQKSFAITYDNFEILKV